MHRRSRVWHVQFHTPNMRKHVPVRSTGESNRNATLLAVAEWRCDGLPDPTRGRRRLQELLDLDMVLSIIRSAPLAPDGAERIVRIL